MARHFEWLKKAVNSWNLDSQNVDLNKSLLAKVTTRQKPMMKLESF